jgi:F-type H+-transporting ATPase subunit delta
MAALRLLASSVRAARATPTFSTRTYATAVSDKLRVSLVVPHQVGSPTRTRFSATLIGNLPPNNFQVLVAGKEVAQVNIPAATGDMGILSKHEPVIEELRPGVVEVKMLDGESKKWFSAYFHFSSLFLIFRLCGRN